LWHNTEPQLRLSTRLSRNAVISGPKSPSDVSPQPGDPVAPGLDRESIGAAPVRAERADKARNRARILAAASEAFAERGVETQMDDVATRAGLGVGTLYRHFATKEALMVALVERKFALILEVTRRGIDCEHGDAFDVFADVMREGAEVAAADATAQDALMRAGDVIWDGVEPTLVELRAATQVLIDRAQAAGTLRRDFSADDVPMVMCGVSATMAVHEWDWRRHLEILLDGLRVEPQLA
jgi:AcrR family transcriptional regulator